MRYRFLLALLLISPTIALADVEKDCERNDPYLKKVCADSNVIEKAKVTRAKFLSALSQVKTFKETQPVVSAKLNLRSGISLCRINFNTAAECTNKALDVAIEKLDASYTGLPSDPSSGDIDLLKSAFDNIQKVQADARDVVRFCMKGEADRLDDGLSPASDIGIAVANSCKPTAQAYVSLVNDLLYIDDVLNPMGTMSLGQVRELAESSFGQNTGTQVVLESRAEKRTAEAAKAAPKSATKKKKSVNM